MYQVYIGQVLNYSHLPLLYPNLGSCKKPSWLFLNKAFANLQKPFVNITSQPQKADFWLFPHHFDLVRQKKEYLFSFSQQAERFKKKVVVFDYGDSDDSIDLENLIVFRTSQYRYKIGKNEIMMPAYAEDLGGQGWNWRKKKGKLAVGFCGWASYKDYKQLGLVKVKCWWWKSKALVSHKNYYLAHQAGLELRWQTMKALVACPKIQTNFIIRKNYSGHREMIELKPAKARQAYVENIKAADFTLVVKGNGNYSLRFYETISLGRLPLFLDTDCVLPLEEIIPYKKFVLFVPLSRLEKIGNIVFNYYTKLTGREYINKQKLARTYFEKYLRIDKFFKVWFLDKKLNQYLKI